MKLHIDKKLFEQSIRFTSDQLQIPAVYVEKDYWVTLALWIIFNSDLSKDVVFKGGTALSKCFKLIDRFSEDIDLVLLKEDGVSDTQHKNKLGKISKLVSQLLPEKEIEGITNKKGNIRKTVHEYDHCISGDFGQIRDRIIIESSWLGSHEPNLTFEINSLLAETIIKTGNTQIVEDYQLQSFKVQVLAPSRTFCEKIMSLIRFSYFENNIDELKLKVRHTYDLHKLLSTVEIQDFVESNEFKLMMLKVASDDLDSFQKNLIWISNHPAESLFFKKLGEIWPKLVQTYKTDFRNLVYGQLPDPDLVFESLNKIATRLKDIDWHIDMGE